MGGKSPTKNKKDLNLLIKKLKIELCKGKLTKAWGLGGLVTKLPNSSTLPLYRTLVIFPRKKDLLMNVRDVNKRTNLGNVFCEKINTITANNMKAKVIWLIK